MLKVLYVSITNRTEFIVLNLITAAAYVISAYLSLTFG